MSFDKGSTPTPPNPIAVGAAQTGTNVSTGVANAFLNNVNQQTPNGNLSYSTDPANNYNWTDPVSGANYSIPRFTATQTLSPQGAVMQPETNAIQWNTGQIGKKLSWDLMNQFNAGGGTVLAQNDPYGAGNPNFMGGMPDALTSFGGYGQQQTSLGNTGQQQTQFDASGMPISNTFDNAGQQQGSFADVGGPQGGFGYVPGQTYGFGGAGDVTHNYGPGDFSADRDKVQQSLMARINPQLDVERNQLEQRLADQGIRYGSDAYNNAMAPFNQRVNDAQFSAINQAGTEQQRMMDMAAQRAGFQNAAQQQEYLQAQGRGTFYNTAQQATFGQEQARGQFANAAQQQAYQQAQGRGAFANQAQQAAYEQAQGRGAFANQAEAQAFAEAKARGEFTNSAQAQDFQQKLQGGTFANQAQKDQYQQAATSAQFTNAGLAQQMAQKQAAYTAQNTSRAQWLSEQYEQANQGINQISALLSGSQVAKPSFVNTGTNNIATTDYAGLINNNFSQNLDIYKQQSANFNSLMGGIFGMMGGLAKAVPSDERIKDVGDKVGTVFAAGPDGEKPLPIYEFAYKDDPASTRHVGPMAQDVEKIDPRAVKTIGGVKHIDTTRMGSILRPVVLKKAA